jgi:glycosyltransferase involved in cell wall biosynthesis
MRQTPRYSTCGWVQRHLNPYWRLRPRAFAAMRLRLGSRFRLCTDSALLSRDYARVYDGPILTLPIPLTSDVRSGRRAGPPDVLRRHPLKDGPGPTVGYLGDARTPKGFPLLPGAVRCIQDAGLAARFLIQCPLPAGGADAETARALDELRALSADPRSSVTLIPEHLGDADYAGLLDALDVVLLPYVHSNYLEATSGVFTEALAKGIPVVVPTATWMAHELAGSTAGEVFAREEPEAFPKALLRVLASLDQHKVAARGRRDAWQATHNPGALVGQLLAATCAPQRQPEAPRP